MSGLVETPAPIAVLDGVFARDSAGPRGAARGTLQGVSAALGPGVHVFLGAPEDGTIALCDALAGARRPLRGAVRVHGESPWDSGSARARVGALLAAADIPDARSVRASVEAALAAMGRSASEADATLAAAGIASLARRSTASLSFSEARAVELALALTVARVALPPAFVVLFDPFSDVAIPAAAAAVDAAIASLRAEGACVAIATSSPSDARRVADVLWILHRGALVRREGGDGKGLAFGDAEIAVAVGSAGSSAVRALAAALAEHPAVRAAYWDDPPAEAGRGPSLRVRGPDRDACALAVIDAAAKGHVALEAITSVAPDLAAVRSASVAWIQKARSAVAPLRAQAPRAQPAAPAPQAVPPAPVKAPAEPAPLEPSEAAPVEAAPVEAAPVEAAPVEAAPLEPPPRPLPPLSEAPRDGAEEAR